MHGRLTFYVFKTFFLFTNNNTKSEMFLNSLSHNKQPSVSSLVEHMHIFSSKIDSYVVLIDMPDHIMFNGPYRYACPHYV
jgi:hypothetical protein